MPGLIVYVDGFNLYNGLRDKYQHRYLWLDLCELSRRLRPRDTLVKVRYFTALVVGQPDAEARQKRYLRALSAHNGSLIEIHRGRYQRKSMHCRNCNHSWTSYEEKETDVNIAVSLVADVATGAATSALIISADSDLCPAVRTARSLNPQVHIAAAFPPQRNSAELQRILPGSFPIGRGRFAQSLLPEVVLEPLTGQNLKRPPKWT